MPTRRDVIGGTATLCLAATVAHAAPAMPARSGTGPSKSTGETGVRHRTIEVDGLSIFYREAGPRNAPLLLLPHGYPCSSYEFRNLMPALADRYRVIAPDFPGFGYSATPDPGKFAYDFDAYAAFLGKFTDRLGLDRYTIWLHDYASQIGLRHAIAAPERIAGVILQNGDIYEDALGPKYDTIKAYWADKTAANRAKLEGAVNEEGFKAEFIGEVDEEIALRVPPDLWTLHWALMDTPVRRRLSVQLMEGLEANLAWFPRYQKYLRDHQPAALILWGPKDGYMPEPAARAYLRDLPKADFHLLPDAGHWLLETHLAEAIPIVRNFLQQHSA